MNSNLEHSKLIRIKEEPSCVKHIIPTYKVIYQQPVELGTHIAPKVFLSVLQIFLYMLVCVQAVAWW